MKILYDSLTGNVGRFVKKLPLKTEKITTELTVNEPFILITYTTGLGHVPVVTETFLNKNNEFLRAVASSGNKNFGAYFALASDVISKKYDVPIVANFELSGTPTDVKNFMKGLDAFETHRIKQ